MKYDEWKMEYDEWKSDILKYFIRQIDIWLKYFVKGNIEEIKAFIISDRATYLGMELLEDGTWYQLCFSHYEWQIKYLENVHYQIKDDVKGSCYLDELWFYFCEDASDDEKSRMISDIVSELQNIYHCKVTAINERIQLKL